MNRGRREKDLCRALLGSESRERGRGGSKGREGEGEDYVQGLVEKPIEGGRGEK